MASWSEGNVQANEINIHYYRSDGGNKRSILLLHGIADSGLCWPRAAADLQGSYEVIMTDARGHGHSGTSANFSIALLADDAAAVIRALGLEKPYVWGHSMGAITAALLAASYPDLVRAALLEDPPLRDRPQLQADGSNTWDYAHYVFTLLHHYLSNGVNGFVHWNMVLPPGGRSTWGWTQNSMITVDAAQQTVTYNPEFYVMKHFAHFVPPGSVRRDLQGPWSGNALAFQTSDHSTVVVSANPFREPVEVVIDVAGDRFSLCLDPHSFNTLVLNG